MALTSICARQSSSVVRASGALLETPALLTSTSTGPMRSNAAATAASSVTSHVSRPSATTCSPAASKRSTTARPMPRVPPVTTTTRLMRSPSAASARAGAPVVRRAGPKRRTGARRIPSPLPTFGRREPERYCGTHSTRV